MKTINRLSKKYIAEVKRNLKCSGRQKRKFLETLIPEIYNFQLENPNAVYDDYINEFNTPKITAEDYMKELSCNQKFAYYVPFIGAIIAIVFVAFAFLLTLFIIQIDADSGYTVESPAIEVSECDGVYTYENDLPIHN